MSLITNPTFLSWNAPLTREDGTVIENPLSFELGIRYEDQEEITPIMVVVGELQADGTFKAPISADLFNKNVPIEFFLRAIDRQSTDDGSDDLYSVWTSESVVVKFVSVPNPPTNFTAA